MNTLKAKQYARAYLENDMNATAALRAVEPSMRHRKDNYPFVKAGMAIRSVKVIRALNEELDEAGLTRSEVAKLTKRNAAQARNLAASNTALDMTNKVRGDYAPEKRATLNIHAEIKTEEEADRLIASLMEEVRRLEDPKDTRTVS